MLSREIILGIDPGLVKTGWGVISKGGYDIKYVDCGVISTKSDDSMENRLVYIFDSIQKLVVRYKPDKVAMEEVFVNTNPRTSEKLIMARTAAFVSLAKLGYMVHEYKPNEIKKNVTGAGHATKSHVHTMVQKILSIDIKNDNKSRTYDSVDALAVAISCSFSRCYSRGNPIKTKK